MRYLLIVILTLFFIGCYEEDMELDFCDNHICHGECREGIEKSYIYKDNELFMITCLSKCDEKKYLFLENDNAEIGLESCELKIIDNDGICKIESFEGGYCSEFFSKYED